MAMKARYTVMDGEVLAENRNGVVERDYLPDALGTTVALLDSGQNPTDSLRHWPYGEERSRTGSVPTPFTFAGTCGYYKDSTNQFYVRARTLNVRHGRWLSRDPSHLGPAEGNAYAYTTPTNFVDPLGLFAQLPPRAKGGNCGEHLGRRHWPYACPVRRSTTTRSAAAYGSASETFSVRSGIRIPIACSVACGSGVPTLALTAQNAPCSGRLPSAWVRTVVLHSVFREPFRLT